MLGGFLAAGSFLGGGIGGFLNGLENAGFFNYALPFLLIFALIFGILSKMKVFGENKGVMAIISLAVGLMALQFNVVPQFFSKIFPSLGIGLSIVLVLLIVAGFFMDPDKGGLKITFFVIAIIIALVVIVSSSGIDIGTWVKDNLGDSAVVIITVALVGLGIAAIMGAFKKRDSNKPAITFNPTAFKQN
ncbi:MAG: hypothetical protein PHH00_03745 [Candidatus Nanoarchaeia archaeon]|nr:hypothetical protein [Candidatus Nanoarchaeia archaeon]